MRRRSASWRTLAALVLALSVLASCSHSGSKKAKATTTTAKAEPAVPGGRLRIGLTRLTTLDPAQARTVEQLLVVDQLFDSLTAYDSRTLDAVPSIAKSWTASPDQRQWDFTLNPDATFANGRPITADDVKYSLERIARKGSGSPATDELSSVTGYKPFAVDGTAPTLAGVTVPAPGVVHISLDSPWALLPVALASPVFGIVPKEAVEAPSPQFGQLPVGSGPFMLASRADDRLVLTKAPHSNALLDGIDVFTYDTIDASYQAFVAGTLDWSRVPPEEVEAAASRYTRDGFQPYVAALYFAFNMKSPTFADPRFRQAIVHAVDRRAIAVGVYQGTVLSLNGPLVQGMPGHVDDPCGDRCVHDVDKAKQLLAAAFPAGTPVPVVHIDYDEDETGQKVAEVIKGNLEEAGIPADLRPKPAAAYPDFAAGPDKQLFRLAWIAPYPSPDAVLPQLFSSGSPFNLEGYTSPAVDAAIGAARSDPDPARRLAHFQDAERKVMADLPVLPIAQFLVHSVSAPTVRDLKLTPAGTFDGSKVWLSRKP